MVQVLPYVPSFGERLTPILNDALAKVGEGFQKRAAMKNLSSLLSGNQTASPSGTEGAENQSAPGTPVSAITPLQNLQIYSAAEQALGPEAAKVLTSNILEQQKGFEKERLKEVVANKEKSASKATIQTVIDRMSSLLEKNAPGIGISPLTAAGISRKGVQNRAEFKNLRGRIEATLLPLESKGTLSKPRFDFILSQIPDGSESQREIAGKLKGLAQTLSEEGFPVNTDILKKIPWFNQSESNGDRPPLESFVR